MPPSILDAAASVQRAVGAPRGSLRHGGPLPDGDNNTPAWSVLDAQSVDRVPVDALRYPRSVWTYNDMQRDSQVAGLLLSAWLPVLHMEYYVDQARAPASLAQEVAEDLGLPLGAQGDSDDDGIGVSWDELATTALLAMAGGHRFFEETGEIRDGKYRLTGLYDRTPETVQGIYADDTGLSYIRVPASDAYLKANPGAMHYDVPADHLLPYVWGRRGADWSGRPVLYSMYRNWLLKDQLVRGDVVTKRRFGGLPVMEDTIPDVSPEAHLRGAEIAMRARSGDLSGLAAPYGQRLRIVGVEGTLPDAIASIEYHDGQMARAFMQMFAELGKNGGGGSYALSETLMDHYALGVLAAAKWLVKSTMLLVRRLADRNYGRDTPLPQIRFRHDDHADYTADAMAALVTSGAIVVDDDLENTVRSRGNLPARTTPRPPPAPKPAAARQRPPAGAAADAVDAEDAPRAPSPEEQAAGYDPDAFLAETRDRTDALVVAWNTVLAAQVDEAVAAAMAAATPLEAAEIRVEPTGADLILDAMKAAAAVGAEQALAEAAHQGVDLDAPDLDALATDLLGPDAEARAATLARAVSGQAASAALTFWGTRGTARADPRGATAGLKDLGKHVRDALTSASAAGRTRSLGGAVHGAINQGRFAVMDLWGPRGDVYASELTDLLTGKPDPACCGPCAAEDGTKFASMKEGRASYPFGGFVGCEGQDNCRGTLVVVAKGETP